MSGKRYDHDYDIDPETGCWVWARGPGPSGYGVKSVNGKRVRAHRHYYEQAKGPIPDGLQIDHLCRNPACVNPEHLEAVTQAQNTRRGAASKLTWGQVCDIRRRSSEGGVTQQQLADEYGVTQGTVWHIIVGKKWTEPDQPYSPVVELERPPVRRSFTSDTLCECGCGRFTQIARITRTEKGHVKGQPLRFIHGHNRKTALRAATTEGENDDG